MFEQQSTINLNMPLRYLHYGSEIYREIYPNNYLHKRSMLKIPTPHFITFYNGREKMNERVQILRLSDMFEQKTQMPELELVVTVININPEKDEHKIINNMSLTCDCDEYMKKAITNADILNRCKSLNDYMIFVNKVRNKTDNEGKDVRAAVIEAVDECINENVLSEFFIKHRDEVIDVSVFEYDEKGVMDIMREEGKEEGIKEGKTEAKIEIFKGMMKKLDKSAEEVLDMVEMDDEEKKNQWTYYINQLNEVDTFLNDLITELSKRDEDTIVVAFGDHLPTMGLEDSDMKSGDIYKTNMLHGIIWD